MTSEEMTLASWRCEAETWLLFVLLLDCLILHLAPALVPIQVPLHTNHCFLHTPSPFVASSHFVHGALLFCGPILLFFLTFKFLAQGHQWSLEYYFNTSCWGMDLYLWMKWDTFRHHFQSKSERQAPKQSSLSTNWSCPLGFVYLNETLRPWGVCWGEVRNAKYRFGFFFFIFRFCSGFFSFLSQPFNFMIQKSLVNIPARQLYWALQRPPLCTELFASQHSFCDTQLFTSQSFHKNRWFRR